MIDAGLLAILACPNCRSPLRSDQSDPGRPELVCTGCGLAYPVRDEIPVLLVEEARRPRTGRTSDPTTTEHTASDGLVDDLPHPDETGEARRPGVQDAGAHDPGAHDRGAGGG